MLLDVQNYVKDLMSGTDMVLHPARSRSGLTSRPYVGTIWEQLRPNTVKIEGLGPTSKQDESTR